MTSHDCHLAISMSQYYLLKLVVAPSSQQQRHKRVCMKVTMRTSNGHQRLTYQQLLLVLLQIIDQNIRNKKHSKVCMEVAMTNDQPLPSKTQYQSSSVLLVLVADASQLDSQYLLNRVWCMEVEMTSHCPQTPSTHQQSQLLIVLIVFTSTISIIFPESELRVALNQLSISLGKQSVHH